MRYEECLIVSDYVHMCLVLFVVKYLIRVNYYRVY